MDDPQTDTQDPTNPPTNVKLIYDYTEALYKGVSDNIDAINTRLGAVIGFSGLLLRFAVDLPDVSNIIAGFHCNTCLMLKIACCGAAIVSILLAAFGLTGNPAGRIVKPNTLLDKYYTDTEEKCRLYITRTWIQAIEDMRAVRQKQARKLNQAIWALVVAAIASGVDILMGIWADQTTLIDSFPYRELGL